MKSEYCSGLFLIKMKEKIIQGIKGSFLMRWLWTIFLLGFEECLSFDAVVDALSSGKVKQAVMALENSIAGSIIPNYALIDHNNLTIIRV